MAGGTTSRQKDGHVLREEDEEDTSARRPRVYKNQETLAANPTIRGEATGHAEDKTEEDATAGCARPRSRALDVGLQEGDCFSYKVRKRGECNNHVYYPECCCLLVTEFVLLKFQFTRSTTK